MGEQGTEAQLDEVLAGDLLDSWRRKHREMVAGGWFWKYELRSIRVVNVHAQGDGSVQVRNDGSELARATGFSVSVTAGLEPSTSRFSSGRSAIFNLYGCATSAATTASAGRRHDR